jgi:hypothetical protein
MTAPQEFSDMDPTKYGIRKAKNGRWYGWAPFRERPIVQSTSWNRAFQVVREWALDEQWRNDSLRCRPRIAQMSNW